jgi:hypothetical protein
MNEDKKNIGRPSLRPSLREDDPRARAAKRAAELREHLDGTEDDVDEFYIDPSTIPDGWSYEWKRHTFFNKEDPAYQVSLARRGWEPVPADRIPGMMPVGSDDKIITRKGMVLMERPLEITEEARARERRSAREQVKIKESQLSSAPQGQFERSNKGDSLAKIKRSHEPMPIPE